MEESFPYSTGKSHSCPALRLLTNKVGGMFCRKNTTNKYRRLDAKVERKMIEVREGASGDKNFRSINSVILRFPQFKEQLQEIRAIFQQYDEDCDGVIDLQELQKCLQKLQFNLTEQDVEDIFHSCDVKGIDGIEFNEFVVILCLCHLLAKSPTSTGTASRTGSLQLEATFDTMIEAFMFMDKNKDGKLNKKDMVKALNDTPWERSPSHLTRTRFSKLLSSLQPFHTIFPISLFQVYRFIVVVVFLPEEMDKDKNGTVTLREFLFTLVGWLGLEVDEEIPVTSP